MSRISLVVLVCALSSATMFGQKLLIEIDTQEGQLLQQIDNEKDAAKKFFLLEQFAAQFPNHEAATWVLSHIQQQHLENKNYDKVFETGAKILSIDPLELSAAHNCLRAAEAKKELPLIRLWSSQTSKVARKVMQLKRPEYGDDEEIAVWKQKVEYARQVEQYTEYSLYFASIQTKDTKVKSELIEALEQRNPTSEYLAQMRTSHTAVVRQVDIVEAVASAEIQFERVSGTRTCYSWSPRITWRSARKRRKSSAYSLKLLELLETKAKPEDISDAEWDVKKRHMLGTANWMAGLLFSTQEKFARRGQALASRRAISQQLRHACGGLLPPRIRELSDGRSGGTNQSSRGDSLHATMHRDR